MALPLKSGGWLHKVLPLHKWRRPDGLSSFLADMIALRHTLCLCSGCEVKMPGQWTSRYNYALVKGFMAELTACDYCRQLRSVNMYCPEDGAYHQEMVQWQRTVSQVRAREQAALAKDRKYLVGH